MTDKNVAAANEETKEIKFKDDLVLVADNAQKHFKSDATTGTITLPESIVFGEELGAAQLHSVTPESYENHRKFEDLINNGLTLAGSRESVELFKQNPELQKVVFKVQVGKKDSYEGVFNRKGTSRNPGTGEVSSYVGSVGVGRINVVSTRSNAEWQNIKRNLRNLAEAAGLE